MAKLKNLSFMENKSVSEIKQIAREYAQKFNDEIETFFELPSGFEKKTVEAMKYSITNGGKRLRAFLVYETAKLFGIEFEESIRTSVALEMIHAYSLIHDDLPAMDDDVLRRGVPTCHIKFDEATAILAGDGLQTLAFEVLADEKTHIDAKIRCKLISYLANSAGAFTGMIAGQTLDIFAETYPNELCDEKMVKDIEKMKTGRLIKFACEAGAILGNANDKEFIALCEYASKIGQAFQIADDILDAIGDEKKVGKTLNKDDKKVTFVSIYGIDKAKKIAKDLIEQAKEDISIFEDKANNLKLLADYMIDRDY